MKRKYEYRRNVPCAPVGSRRDEIYRAVDHGDGIAIYHWPSQSKLDDPEFEPGLLAVFDALELESLIDDCGGFPALVEVVRTAFEREDFAGRSQPRQRHIVNAEMVRDTVSTVTGACDAPSFVGAVTV